MLYAFFIERSDFVLRAVHLKYSLNVCVTVDVPDTYSTLAILNDADAIFKENIEFAYDDKVIDDCNIGSCYSFTLEEE